MLRRSNRLLLPGGVTIPDDQTKAHGGIVSLPSPVLVNAEHSAAGMPQHSRRTYNASCFLRGECSEKCSDHPSRRAGKGYNHIAANHSFCKHMLTSDSPCQLGLE